MNSEEANYNVHRRRRRRNGAYGLTHREPL